MGSFSILVVFFKEVIILQPTTCFLFFETNCVLPRAHSCLFFLPFNFGFSLSFFLLVKTVEAMLFALVRGFIILIMLIFFGFSFFDYVNFGASRASSSTLWRALGHQYSRLHGNFDFTKSAGSMVWSSVPKEHISGALVVFFSVLVVIVLLNLALTIVLEVYNASEENNDTLWAEQQASELLFYRKRCLNVLVHAFSSAKEKVYSHCKSKNSVIVNERHSNYMAQQFDLLDLPGAQFCSSFFSLSFKTYSTFLLRRWSTSSTISSNEARAVNFRPSVS